MMTHLIHDAPVCSFSSLYSNYTTLRCRQSTVTILAI